MSQEVLCQKIWFLGQKLWPVACGHTDNGMTIEYLPYQGFSLSERLPMIWAVQYEF